MINLELAEKVRTYALTKVRDQKFSEDLMVIAQLLSGVRVKEQFGGGRWFDISERTFNRVRGDALAKKEWELHLYKSGKLSYRFGPDPRRDMDKLIASVEADIAVVQSTF